MQRPVWSTIQAAHVLSLKKFAASHTKYPRQVREARHRFVAFHMTVYGMMRHFHYYRYNQKPTLRPIAFIGYLLVGYLLWVTYTHMTATPP